MAGAAEQAVRPGEGGGFAGPWVDAAVASPRGWLWVTWGFAAVMLGLAAYALLEPRLADVRWVFCSAAAVATAVGVASLWMKWRGALWLRAHEDGLMVQDRGGRRLVRYAEIERAEVRRQSAQFPSVTGIVLGMQGIPADAVLPAPPERTFSAGMVHLPAAAGPSRPPALFFVYDYRTADGDPLQSAWDRLGDRVARAG